LISIFSSTQTLAGFEVELSNLLNDTTVQVWSNGEVHYHLRGVQAKVSVNWDYQVPGGNDTHYAMMRGTKANLVIRQGMKQQYKPVLYIEPIDTTSVYEKSLLEEVKKIQAKYPGVELKKISNDWEVIIPDKYKEGHESHFARATENLSELFQKPQYACMGSTKYAGKILYHHKSIGNRIKE
jgi:hypothetical protein